MLDYKKKIAAHVRHSKKLKDCSPKLRAAGGIIEARMALAFKIFFYCYCFSRGKFVIISRSLIKQKTIFSKNWELSSQSAVCPVVKNGQLWFPCRSIGMIFGGAEHILARRKGSLFRRAILISRGFLMSSSFGLLATTKRKKEKEKYDGSLFFLRWFARVSSRL